MYCEVVLSKTFCELNPSDNVFPAVTQAYKWLCYIQDVYLPFEKSWLLGIIITNVWKPLAQSIAFIQKLWTCRVRAFWT